MAGSYRAFARGAVDPHRFRLKSVRVADSQVGSVLLCPAVNEGSRPLILCAMLRLLHRRQILRRPGQAVRRNRRSTGLGDPPGYGHRRLQFSGYIRSPTSPDGEFRDGPNVNAGDQDSNSLYNKL
jgi:hypothetical protein